MKRRTVSFLKKEAKRLKRKELKETLGARAKLYDTQVIRRFGEIAGLYKSKRGLEYFGWYMKMSGFSSPRVVPLHTLRLTVLRDCVVWAAEAVEKNELKPEELEIVLDYLFAEMNRRVNKEPKQCVA